MIASAGRGAEAGAPAAHRTLVVAGVAVAAAVSVASYGLFSGVLVAAACAATWRLAPLVASFAIRHNATVLPGGRSIHGRATPLLGGIAVGAPVLATLAAAGGGPHTSLALGGAFLIVAGAVDDLYGLSPFRKLLLQVLAAGALHAGGYRIDAVHCDPFVVAIPGLLQPAALVFWVLLVTNAFNLIDGLDGLASGAGIMACLVCVALGGGTFVPLVLAGALLGFLRHNLPPAGIFLGDAGSLALGFTLSALLMDLPRGFSLPVAAGALALPLGDLALCALRRVLRGKPIFRADRGHVHHRLLRVHRRPARVLGILLAFAAVQAGIALARPDAWGLAAGAAVWAGLVLYLVSLRRARSPLVDVLRQRRTFKRFHLLRHYAEESLRLAQGRADVKPILRRVAEDLNLVSLRLRDFHVAGERGDTETLVLETLDCGDTIASWTCRADGEDGLADERRAILGDLLRRADGVLRRIPATAAATPAGSRRRVHFIAAGRGDLLRLRPVVASARERGVLHPVIVHTGRRDSLDLGTLPRDVQRSVEPDIDLDVDVSCDALRTAYTMDRYGELLDVVAPAMVVVAGGSPPAVACAFAAKKRRLTVVHLGADPGETVEPFADLRVPPCVPAERRETAFALESYLGAETA